MYIIIKINHYFVRVTLTKSNTAFIIIKIIKTCFTGHGHTIKSHMWVIYEQTG